MRGRLEQGWVQRGEEGQSREGLEQGGRQRGEEGQRGHEVEDQRQVIENERNMLEGVKMNLWEGKWMRINMVYNMGFVLDSLLIIELVIKQYYIDNSFHIVSIQITVYNIYIDIDNSVYRYG